ncbi:MAG TPA: extracellular solute-binding protein [Candidatus Binatia bacterium]|jgi:iron(III) transport system substrate-binding protein
MKGFLLLLLFVLNIFVAVPARAQKSAEWQRLVDGARKEGRLDLMIVSSMGEKGARDLVAAFKKRFGLDIVINADLSGQESQKFNRAVAEVKAGIPPTFDLMEGPAETVLSLKDAGGADRVEGWQNLLADIAPEAYKVRDRVSPFVLAGYGFVWSTRTTAILYNPERISEKELPKTWKDLGNPKYRGMFPVPPWTTIPLLGLLKYEKAEWLEVVKAIGKNKRDILTYDAGVERVLLGDMKFTFGNADSYFEHKQKDAKAPIGLTFFEDLTTVRPTCYVVRKGAAHPNAAKLFMLWAAGVEANEIFEKNGIIENAVLAQGPISRKIAATLQSRHIKPLSWFDSQQTAEKLQWLSTPEGTEYSRAIAKAQREGQ